MARVRYWANRERELEKLRKKREKRGDKAKEYNRKRRAENPELIKKQRREWMKKHRSTPEGMVELRLRGRLRKAIARHASKEMKAASTMNLVGCNRKQLKEYIESKFLPGMSWENSHLWHIDHRKPVALFDLTTEAGQRACFHYTNLQPLWAPQNLRKGKRYVLTS